MNRRSRTLWGGGPVSALQSFGMRVFGRPGSCPLLVSHNLLCKVFSPEAGEARRAGFGSMPHYRNPRPAFAPPRRSQGGQLPGRRVGEGFGDATDAAGPWVGEFRWGGGAGEWGGRPGGPEAGGLAEGSRAA